MGKHFSNTSKNNKIKKQLNNNIILSKKNGINKFGKKKISTSIINSEKKKEIKNHNNKSILILENNNINNIQKNNVNINEINIVNNINKNNENNNKNDEQLKQIKSGLDENLKFLFNFSYENFLNKESESESKKSASEYNNINIELSNQKESNKIINNKKRDISYQPKYK